MDFCIAPKIQWWEADLKAENTFLPFIVSYESELYVWHCLLLAKVEFIHKFVFLFFYFSNEVQSILNISQPSEPELLNGNPSPPVSIYVASVNDCWTCVYFHAAKRLHFAILIYTPSRNCVCYVAGSHLWPAVCNPFPPEQFEARFFNAQACVLYSFSFYSSVLDHFMWHYINPPSSRGFLILFAYTFRQVFVLLYCIYLFWYQKVKIFPSFSPLWVLA